jgi:hypothetical protein
MDKVFSKPLHLKDFSQLMIEMKYITNVPEHLKQDEEYE